LSLSDHYKLHVNVNEKSFYISIHVRLSGTQKSLNDHNAKLHMKVI